MKTACCVESNEESGEEFCGTVFEACKRDFIVKQS